MDSPVLVTYATKHGATAEIAEKIGETLRGHDLEVDVRPVDDVRDLTVYHAVVLGSAVYAGQWRKEAVRFLTNNEKALAGRLVWLFSSGPTGEGDPVELLKGWQFPEGQKEVADRIEPQGVVVFHGVLDPETLSTLERFVVKNVKAPMGDFRDWDAVVEWAATIAEALKESQTAQAAH